MPVTPPSKYGNAPTTHPSQELHSDGVDHDLHRELGSYNNEPKPKKRGSALHGPSTIPGDGANISCPLNPDAFSNMRGGDVGLAEVQPAEGYQRFYDASPEKMKAISAIAAKLSGNPRWQKYADAQLATAPKHYANIPGSPNEKVVHNLMHEWETKIPTAHPHLVSLMQAAHKELGLKGPNYSHIEPDVMTAANAETATNGEAYRAFARAQYEHTQAHFAAKGITHVPVYRGMEIYPPHIDAGKLDKHVPPQMLTAMKARTHYQSDTAPLHTQPLSSFSTDPNAAHRFTGGDNSVLAGANLSVRRIFSTHETGMGLHNEHECVILGGHHKMFASYSPSFNERLTSDELQSHVARASLPKPPAHLNPDAFGPMHGGSSDAQLAENKPGEDYMARMVRERNEDFASGKARIHQQPLDELAKSVSHISARLTGNQAWADYAHNTVTGPRHKEFDEYPGPESDKAAQGIIRDWAMSSTMPRSIALMRAVHDQLGLKDPAYDHIKPETLAAGDEHYAQHGPALRAFAQAQYDHTQSHYAAKGITHVPLYRGMTLPDDTPENASGYAHVPAYIRASIKSGTPAEDAHTHIHMQPLSSASTLAETALYYGAATQNGYHRVVSGANTPVSKIFSTHETGVGATMASEALLLGGHNTMYTRVSPRGTDSILPRELRAKVEPPGKPPPGLNPDAFAPMRGGKTGIGLNGIGLNGIGLGGIELNGIGLGGIGLIDAAPHYGKSEAEEQLENGQAIAARLKGNPAWEAYAAQETRLPSVTMDELPGEPHEKLVHHWINIWNGASTSMSGSAMRLVKAAHEELGVKDPNYDHVEPAVMARANANYEQDAPALRALARAQYDHTQSKLAAEGITSMPVYRGMRIPQSRVDDKSLTGSMPEDMQKAVATGNTYENSHTHIHAQALSSFSTKARTAIQFAGEPIDHSIVMGGMVPAKDIFSTHHTGMGTQYEHEAVLLGGHHDLYTHYSPPGHDRVSGLELENAVKRRVALADPFPFADLDSYTDQDSDTDQDADTDLPLTMSAPIWVILDLSDERIEEVTLALAQATYTATQQAMLAHIHSVGAASYKSLRPFSHGTGITTGQHVAPLLSSGILVAGGTHPAGRFHFSAAGLAGYQQHMGIAPAAPTAASTPAPASAAAMPPSGPSLGGTGAFHTGGTHRVTGGTAANPNQSYHYVAGAATTIPTKVAGPMSGWAGVPLSSAASTAMHLLNASAGTSSGGINPGGLLTPAAVAELQSHGYASLGAKGDVRLTRAGIQAIHHAGGTTKSQDAAWTQASSGAAAVSLADPATMPARNTPGNESKSAQRSYNSAHDAQTVINSLVGQYAADPKAASDAIQSDPEFMQALSDLRKSCISLNSQYANSRNPKYAAGGVVNNAAVLTYKQELDHYRGMRDALADAAARGIGIVVAIGASASPTAHAALQQSVLQQSVQQPVAAPPPAAPPPAAPPPAAPPAAGSNSSSPVTAWNKLSTDESETLTTLLSVTGNGYPSSTASMSFINAAHGALTIAQTLAALHALHGANLVNLTPGSIGRTVYSLTPAGRAAAQYGATQSPAPAAAPTATSAAPTATSAAPTNVTDMNVVAAAALKLGGTAAANYGYDPSILMNSMTAGMSLTKVIAALNGLVTAGHMTSNPPNATWPNGNYSFTNAGLVIYQPAPAAPPVPPPAASPVPPPASNYVYPGTFLKTQYQACGPNELAILLALSTPGQAGLTFDAAQVTTTMAGTMFAPTVNAALTNLVSLGILDSNPASGAWPNGSFLLNALGTQVGGFANTVARWSNPVSPGTMPPAAPPTAAAVAANPLAGLTPDEQAILGYLTNSRNATTGLHFSAFRTANALKVGGKLIGAKPLLAILVSLQLKGLVNTVRGAVPTSPQASKWVLTGIAGGASVATPTPTAPSPTAPPPPLAGTHTPGTIKVYNKLSPDAQDILLLTGHSTGSFNIRTLHAQQGFQTLGETTAAFAELSKARLIRRWIGMTGQFIMTTPGSDAWAYGTALFAQRNAAAVQTAPQGPAPTTAGSAPGADVFNGPMQGALRIGPNSCFIQTGAGGGKLPGEPVYTTAIRAGRSTMPLNLNDPGPAAGSRPYLDAARYPDRNHAREFGMSYQGPTGGVVTILHGSGPASLSGATNSGLRPGGGNAYGYGLYCWSNGSLGVANSQGYAGGANYEMELHTGRCLSTKNSHAVVQAFSAAHPALAKKYAHDPAKLTNIAALDAGYTSLVSPAYGPQGTPFYIVLDPSRCRIKSVVDNNGQPLRLPNGQMSPPPQNISMSARAPVVQDPFQGAIPKGAWTGLPDLASVKDPTLTARNNAIGADPTVPLSDNGYAAIQRIGKSAGGKMSIAAISKGRDVARMLRPVRGVANAQDLLNILDSPALISGAELKRQIAAAKADTSAAGKALYKKLTSVTAFHNPDDAKLGLDDSVFLTYGSPTAFNSYGGISMVYDPQVLNTPGTKVNLHGVNNYNGGGTKPVNKANWEANEIDGMEATEVMAFQLAAGYPVMGMNGTAAMPENGKLASPEDYLGTHTLLAKEQAEIHVPTSTSHHFLTHIMIPAGSMVTVGGSVNAINPVWNLPPGLYDKLTSSTFNKSYRADQYQQMNNVADGTPVSLGGDTAILRQIIDAAGNPRWQFELPKTATKSVKLATHLQTILKARGLDVRVLETTGGPGTPHSTVSGIYDSQSISMYNAGTHATPYASICYNSL